ncbi:MAG: NAD(P)H-dependent oxidoreductase subunit E [Verrucomicrobia bacterium]|nr:NAD(P)H-dependent oxidoreductase subunit E [Verrucomicrobiota bacterium]
MQVIADGSNSDRGLLIPLLQKGQEVHGFISPATVNQIAAVTGASPSEVFGVASFYSQFRFTKPGKHTVKVCLGTACHIRGSDRILEQLEHHLKIKPGDTTRDEQFSLERVTCFGCCALAPVVVVDHDVHGRMSLTKSRRLLQQYTGK